MKKFFSISLIALLFAVFAGPLSAQTIPALTQFVGTTTPSAITQRTYGKALKITGLSDGCLSLSSSLVTSSGVSCITAAGTNSKWATSTDTTAIIPAGATKVGIGSTTPFSNLSVSTASQQSGALPLFTVASTTNTTLFTVLGNGNVGIGTTSPYSKLSVVGETVANYFTGTNSSNISSFAGGIRIPALEVIDFGDLNSEVFRIYTDGIDAIFEANPSSLIGSNVLISPGQNISDMQAGSVFLYGAPSSGDTPNLNGAVYIGGTPVAEPVGALGSHGTDFLGVGGMFAVNGLTHLRGNLFVGTNSGISAGAQTISLDGNGARSIGIDRAAGLTSAGQALTINAGGAKTTTTNQNGGSLTIRSGIPTGSGASTVTIGAYGGGASGTSDRSITNAVVVGHATTTTATALYVSRTSATSTQYIYSKTAGFGGNIIIEDVGGGACTQLTTAAGVATFAVVTCPTEI